MTEKEFQRELLSAFRGIGYSDYMIEEKNVSFSYKNGHEPHTAKAILYSSQFRKDLETAVIAVQETQNANQLDIESEIKPYETLGTPVIILAEYRKLKTGNEPKIAIYDLMKESVLTSKSVVNLHEFQEYIKKNRDNFSPRKLEEKKVEPFQQKLPLFTTALDLTNKELVQVYELGMKSIFKNEKDDGNKNELYRNSLRLLAARILRDKANENWSLNSASSLIRDAKSYNPNYFHIPSAILKKLDPLISEYLSKEFNFSHIGIETLGYFYEKAVLTSKVKQTQGIYYTPSIIAKTILKRMPIEEIRPENRILLDPTCGSGSFLVAGYERLTQMAYLKENPDARHQRLIKSIFGNEKDSVAAEIAKLTLMLFHPPHKNDWNVFTEDAKENNFAKKIITKLGNKKPTIIVGNLPFKFEQTDKDKQYADNVKRAGYTQEGSAIILNHCLDILDENGQIGLILPEGLTAHTHPAEKELRIRILKDFHLLEQWNLPIGWFKDTNKPALVWILRKNKRESTLFKIIEILNPPIKEKDIPEKIVSSFVEFSGTRTIDLENLPEDMVTYHNEKLINKMLNNSKKLLDYFEALYGLRVVKISIKENVKGDFIYPWIQSAPRKHPFTDLRSSIEGYIDIKKDENFRDTSEDLRNLIQSRKYNILMKANRNNPKKWCSVAIIDENEKSDPCIAASGVFYQTFVKKDYLKYEINYLFSLWILINSNIGNYYLRCISPLLTVGTEPFRNFPLPDCWDDIDKIKNLAAKAKHLLDLKRKYDSDFKSNGEDNEGKLSKSEQTLRNKILSLVKETDKIIYDMYNFTKSEIQQVEDFFGSEKRPGLEELGEDWKQFKPVKKEAKKTPNINEIELKDFGTTFETLEVDYDKLKIKVIINGLREREDGIDVDREGVWIPMTPYMPGWMMKPGANGMVYLKTYDSKLIQEFPEFFIKDFALMKNAYKTIEEIEENVFKDASDRGREVG